MLAGLNRKWLLRFLVLAVVLFTSMAWWVGWGGWPDPELKPLPWKPDVILVLGGGNEERPREALRLRAQFPDVPLIVTGDGGIIFKTLVDSGVPAESILHEASATSTVENAQLTDSMLDRIGAQRVVLVTNWFHAPRASAVFDRYQPDREFVVSFESRPQEMSNWHRYATRRERMAAVLYLVKYGIWSGRGGEF